MWGVAWMESGCDSFCCVKILVWKALGYLHNSPLAQKFCTDFQVWPVLPLTNQNTLILHMAIRCGNPRLVLPEAIKEAFKISLTALHVQPGALKPLPIQLEFSHAASGQTWVPIGRKVNSSLRATSTTQLTQGRQINSSGVPFHTLVLQNAKCV